MRCMSEEVRLSKSKCSVSVALFLIFITASELFFYSFCHFFLVVVIDFTTVLAQVINLN